MDGCPQAPPAANVAAVGPPAVPRPLRGRVFTVESAREVGVRYDELRTSSYRRVAHAVYVDAAVHAEVADDPLLPLAAMLRSLPCDAVLAGTSAALVHGVDVRLRDEPVQVHCPLDHRPHARPGLAISAAALPAADVVEVRGLPVTSPTRTAVDLSRGLPEARRVPRWRRQVEAVVGLDAVLRATGLPPADVPRGCSSGQAAHTCRAAPRCSSPGRVRPCCPAVRSWVLRSPSPGRSEPGTGARAGTTSRECDLAGPRLLCPGP